MSGGIRIRGLTLGYDRHPAIHHLDGTIAPGDLLALVGPNGAGKSTLLKGLVGEVRVLGGRIERGTSDGAIAYLPQAAEIDRDFPLSVLDLVAMGLWRRLGAWSSLYRGRATCEAALAAVGLSGFEGRPIGTLSGGQFQRALFARLIVQDASVILLDEPFTGIDARTVGDLLALIRGWHGQGRTVIAALHDLAQVRAHFSTTLLLAREPIAWGPTAAVLTPHNLERARHLSEAWDETAAICRRDHDDHGHHDHAAHGDHHDHHHPGQHRVNREAAE
ncbi:metal ABC transporter ATP-binding protein [Methylobacterium haplocladii]|uniref:ABC transporter ATP-binding protein n=1 Tax=Methylobacterium haplocladii TaxID=1176176 RepID=A0A512IUQ6_9HYPH|nr:ABC transporter ATP-binding protein [Methylobacterium haplocladii]GEP01396.1 ABC transporter ATP-binding protein [Methylobacterium haplocladii]GJD83803.1 Manganese import ATP-binding protein ScaC [Methylobacterium haplocladii]GLS58287.1 ABC transporter ATP-binding protein [Methylobacterium haplocladii]